MKIGGITMVRNAFMKHHLATLVLTKVIAGICFSVQTPRFRNSKWMSETEAYFVPYALPFGLFLTVASTNEWRKQRIYMQ
jgi:hypothetical protein